MRARRGLAAGLLAVALAPGAGAQSFDAPLAAHAACAEAGAESGVCAGHLTTHCLAVAQDLTALSACRVAMARALEDRATSLGEALAARGQRGRAVEIAAGAARVVQDFCAALAARRAAPGQEGHAARCAMMRAHVTVYHLIRALRETEQAT